MLHYVLHDWPDDAALKILGHLKDAMRQDYSKLLIVEFVVALMNADPFNTALDINIMALVGSKERTESDRRGLSKRLGYRSMESLQCQGITCYGGRSCLRLAQQRAVDGFELGFELGAAWSPTLGPSCSYDTLRRNCVLFTMREMRMTILHHPHIRRTVVRCALERQPLPSVSCLAQMNDS